MHQRSVDYSIFWFKFQDKAQRKRTRKGRYLRKGPIKHWHRKVAAYLFLLSIYTHGLRQDLKVFPFQKGVPNSESVRYEFS